MNKISFKNSEGQQNVGSSLTSSLISTGVTAGVGALGGAGIAKVATIVPPKAPTAEKVIEELFASGDTFVKEQVKTIENINKANLCEAYAGEIDDAVASIAKGSWKNLFKKVDPAKETQEYLRSVMEAIGEKVGEGIELTKEQVKNAVANKRKVFSDAPKEKFEEILNNTRKALQEKADDFLKTAKKGDNIFDRALKSTHQMKKDMKLASFAKWGAIIALGLSILPSFIPKKAQNETTQA